MELESHFDDFTRRDWRQVEDGTVGFPMVGLGWWTQKKAIPAVEASDLCETTVIVSRSAERAEEVVAVTETIAHALTDEELRTSATSVADEGTSGAPEHLRT